MECECDPDSSTDMEDESEPEPDTNDDDVTQIQLDRQLYNDDTQMQLDRQLYEPEPNAPANGLATNTPIDQLEARVYQKHLAKLHIDIKTRAQIPTKPAYQKLYRTWLPRPFNPKCPKRKCPKP
jgi:hypothetical protein